MRWINFSILLLAIGTTTAQQKQQPGTALKHDNSDKRADILSHQHVTEYRARSRTGNGVRCSGVGKFGQNPSGVNTVAVKPHDNIDTESIVHQQYPTAGRRLKGGARFRGRGRRRRLRRRRGLRGHWRRLRRRGLKIHPQMALDTENGTKLEDDFNTQQKANEDECQADPEGDELLTGIEPSEGKTEEFEITEDSLELHPESTTPQPLESNRGAVKPRRRYRGYHRRTLRRKQHPTFGRRRRRRRMSSPSMYGPLRTRPRHEQQLGIDKYRLWKRRQNGQLGKLKLFGKVRTRKMVRPSDGGLYHRRKPNHQQSPGRPRRWNRHGSLIKRMPGSDNGKPKEISHVNGAIGSNGHLKTGTNSYQQPGKGNPRWENSQQGGSSLPNSPYYQGLQNRPGNFNGKSQTLNRLNFRNIPGIVL